MTDFVLARTQTLTADTALTQVGTQVAPVAKANFTISGSGVSLIGALLSFIGLDAAGEEQVEDVVLAATGEYETTAEWSSVSEITPSGVVFTGYSAQVTFTASDDVGFNCDCDDTTGFETLATLRRRLLIRLGFAAQADTPPPGMALLLNDFLYSSQKYLWGKYTGLRSRFFTWIMEPGVRFYDLPDNVDTCMKQLDKNKIKGAWVEDLNGAWLPLFAGIPPEFYTSALFQGIPSRYDIRQCIEVFPAPSEQYKLRIKADFELQEFADDADTTSIESELVFGWALAMAKKHYGQADADAVASQMNTYLGDLTAATHTTKRYIPGTSPALNVPRPLFLPLV